MSRNLAIALAAGLGLPALVALLAPAQEPKEAVPPPPGAARPAELPFPLARELMKAQAPPDPATARDAPAAGGPADRADARGARLPGPADSPGDPDARRADRRDGRHLQH